METLSMPVQLKRKSLLPVLEKDLFIKDVFYGEEELRVVNLNKEFNRRVELLISTHRDRVF